MIENKSKIQVEELDIVKEKNKKRFFSGLRNRLVALAAAGFITLGAGWSKDLLRQLEVEEKNAVVELVSGSEITENTLKDFRGRMEKEEPEFAKLVERYREVIRVQLKGLEDAITQDNINSSGHQEQDRQSESAEQQDYRSGIYRKGSVFQDIDTDHKLIYQLISDPAFLKDNHEFLNANLDDIFWGVALLNDSKDSREAARFIKPPAVIFKTHAPYGIPRGADMTLFFLGVHWQPKITIYPQAFMGPDKHINPNTYKNIFIHELSHVFLAGSGDGKRIDRKMENDFAEVLDEGRIQSITYKIVRYFNRNIPDLKPIYNESDGYDQFLVIAELVESIARTHPNKDFLVEWQLGIIDYKTMLENLRTVFNDLELSSNIYKSIVDFKFGKDKTRTSTKFLNDLLSELRLTNKVNLSDDFVRSILIRE